MLTLFEENAAILRNMEADGSDLGPSRSVDFSHVFADRACADAFAREAKQRGFSVSVEKVDREGEPWDVTASKDMVPTCENITVTEELLHTLAQAHRGRADGWGFFRD
ncbi:ribonuclease E inhibitor RraB [Sphingomonas sp. BK580]|uniref:ribonuclease E inhibitor RraB n=1 Tax=Sphingomonas sp. BK580 TaxID=2586972 RepID=UPI001616D240|nr:ribonuclease E inhibitor RraB [Sphingomonas sp. BK580]MBB3692464.1 regulator of RNase E activity RraB [Sphingomonas sp. BK580]